MIASRYPGEYPQNRDERDELYKELRYLRSLVREISEGFVIRMEGEIETLIGHLDVLPPREIRQASRVWLKEMRNLSVKPSRGRLKDLKRVELLLELLLYSVGNMQTAAPVRAGRRAAQGTEQQLPQ